MGLPAGVVRVDFKSIKVNDVLEIQTFAKVRVLVTYVDQDISGIMLDNNVSNQPKGTRLCFTKAAFDSAVSIGSLKRIGHRAKGIKYT